MKSGIHETTEFLELFLRNLILDEKKELHNRTMHISGAFQSVIKEKDISVNGNEGNVGINVGIKSKKQPLQEKILLLLNEDGRLSARALSEMLEVSQRQVERCIAELKKSDRIERLGAKKMERGKFCDVNLKERRRKIWQNRQRTK